MTYIITYGDTHVMHQIRANNVEEAKSRVDPSRTVVTVLEQAEVPPFEYTDVTELFV